MRRGSSTIWDLVSLEDAIRPMETIPLGAKKNLQDIRPTTDWTLSPCPLVRMVGPYLKLGIPQDEVMVLKVTPFSDQAIYSTLHFLLVRRVSIYHSCHWKHDRLSGPVPTVFLLFLDWYWVYNVVYNYIYIYIYAQCSICKFLGSHLLYGPCYRH